MTSFIFSASKMFILKMATSGPDYFGAATAFKDVDWGFVGQHWWEDNGRKYVTCVGSRDQVCLERICLSTKSPSQMLSAVLLNNTKWFFRFPLINIKCHNYTIMLSSAVKIEFLKSCEIKMFSKYTSCNCWCELRLANA